MTRSNAAGLAIALATLAGCTTTPPPDRSLAAFEAVLAGQDSATAALTEWCAQHAIADPANISARSVGGAPIPPDVSLRSVLEVSEDEPVGYRHVLLSCGDAVLSDAHNWYVPGRLSQEMNTVLETTDTPFGRVVAPLGFTRERFAAERGAAEECPAGTILSHSALLRLPDGRPISMVVECYTSANLSGGANLAEKARK